MVFLAYCIVIFLFVRRWMKRRAGRVEGGGRRRVGAGRWADSAGHVSSESLALRMERDEQALAAQRRIAGGGVARGAAEEARAAAFELEEQRRVAEEARRAEELEELFRAQEDEVWFEDYE